MAPLPLTHLRFQPAELIKKRHVSVVSSALKSGVFHQTMAFQSRTQTIIALALASKNPENKPVECTNQFTDNLQSDDEKNPPDFDELADESECPENLTTSHKIQQSEENERVSEFNDNNIKESRDQEIYGNIEPENTIGFVVENNNVESKISSSSSSSSSTSSSSSATSSSCGDSPADFDSDDSIKDPSYNQSEAESDTEDGVSNEGEIKQKRKSSKVDDESNVKKGRKRQKREGTWKQNVKKKLRNSGKEYETRGKTIKLAREMKAACNKKCYLKCYSKFTEDERKIIFESYWDMGDLQRQRDFVAHSMEVVNPRYKYVREGSTRAPNNAFYFKLKENRIRVCKIFFKNTLNITDRAIRTVLEKRTNVPNILEPEKRGKHRNHKKVDNEIKESVRKHISAIPSVESHYTRAHTTRHFIDGSKTIAEIYRDYVKNRKESNQPVAHYVMFYRIFTEEFNISFFNPKKDRCETCVAFETATGEEKDNLKSKYEKHLKEKDLARKEKQQDKERANKNVIVACYDLQAVFQCPKGNTSVLYYKSKLNVFNLTFFEIESKNVNCFIWHEGEGDRGVNEIGTCVYKFIQKLAENKNEDIEIIFYTDNCGGQQKNKVMISVYMHALLKFPNIKLIQHKFLIAGHTQNEGDSVHSIIERQAKRTLKSGPVYTPDQFVSIIRASKKTGSPYQVNELSHEFFFDMKDLSKQILPSILRNNENEDFKISEIRVIKVDRDYPRSFFYKGSYADEEFQEVKLDRTNKRRSKEKSEIKFENIQLRPAFLKKPRLADRKRTDLMELIQKNYIPNMYRPFFESL